MINEEVGLPLERDAEGENLYILPRIFEENVEDLGIFILTDGNNRARATEGKGYNEGGKNVVKIAESLAERQDVSLMVACILSPENIRKRSDEFFYDMYKAFIGLGVKMETDGTLTNANIRLEVHGGLQALRERGGYALKLADMIEAVVAKTAYITDPSLRLLFGVDYDADTALDLGVHAIFRSGMEDSSSLRLSGTRSYEGIANYGSTKLWPDVTAEDVSAVIDDAKTRMARTFDIGYSPDFIVKMIEAEHRTPSDKPFQATMTARASMPELLKMLDAFYAQNPDMLHTLRVIVLDKEGRAHREFGSHNGVAKKLRILPGSHHKKTDVHDGGYKAILAPGQYESREFVLPDYPEIGYANVHKCEATPEGVVAGIRHAISFAQDNVSLKGAERFNANALKPKTSLAAELPDYQYFQRLKGSLNGQWDDPVSPIASDLTQNKGLRGNRFDLYADIFTTQMMQWGQAMNVPQERDVQFQAYMGYLLTAFFIAYDPEHPQWKNWESLWLELGRLLAQYKTGVYTGDEVIFDRVYDDESAAQREERIKQAADYLMVAVLDDSFDISSLPDINENEKKTLLAIAQTWRDILGRYAEVSHEGVLQDWREALANLYESSLQEYNPEVTNNPLIEELRFGSDKKVVRQQLEDQYCADAPEVLRDRMQKLMDKAADEQLNGEGSDAARELQLMTYLLDVNNSIGAGLVYRTAALIVPRDEVTEEMRSKLNDVCVLSNCCYRIANDMAGLLKSYASDDDQKEDSCSIMIDPHLEHFSRATAEIKGLAQLMKVREWLQSQFEESVRDIVQVWPYIGNVIRRGGLGFKVYSEAHYKDVTREQMGRFMSEYEDQLKNDKNLTIS